MNYDWVTGARCTVQDDDYVRTRLVPAKGRGVYQAMDRDGRWLALRVYVIAPQISTVNIAQLMEDATRNVYAPDGPRRHAAP